MSQADLFQSLLRGQPLTEELQTQFPFYPLTSPGMPIPGPNFLSAAQAMGDPEPVYTGRSQKEKRLASHGPALEYLYRRAMYDENFALRVASKGGHKTAQLVPGHLLGDETSNLSGGPRPANVMLFGKNPGRDEIVARRNFVGPTSQILFDALDELGVGDERFDWYVDNLVHWAQVDEQSDGLPTAYKKDCDVLLHQTLRLVRPNYLLCLGSDASKWLLGTDYGVTAMVGRVNHLTFPISGPGEDVQYHTVKVMAVTHPASVHRTPELYPEFKDQIALFLGLVNGVDVGRREVDVNYRNVYKHRELKRIVDDIVADPDPLRRIIAVDGEWEGEPYESEGNYLRTVQFSTKHGEGITVVLRHQGGEPAFKPSIDHAVTELRRLLKSRPDEGYFPRVGGHFLRADLPWLIREGIDVRDEYAPAPSPDRCRDEGGWDTSLAYHAYNESTSYRLTDVMVRLTSIPVYDGRIKQTITDYCSERGLKKEDLDGFGFLPPWILHPEPTDPEAGENYAAMDADATRRIIIRHLEPGGLLDKDWFGNSSWEPYWRSHMASLGVLEMETSGISLDRDRVDRQTTLFMEARQRLLDTFRQAINWPQFNPESQPQCVAFLFGDRFSQKRDKATGEILASRPPGAVSLGLEPLTTTGKRPRLWADVVSRGEEHAYKPSVNKEVLGILGHAHPLAMQLRDLKFIMTVLKGPLRPPIMTDDGMTWAQDDDGNLQYSKGLASAAQADGKVHTHISQNKETGRGSSARPPLQVLSKRREGDYSRILGTWETDAETGQKVPKGDYLHVFGSPQYIAPIRTIFKASPGCVLIESDLSGAELAGLAWLANDPDMIEAVRRNSLPESDPNFIDIHSAMAVEAFRLNCAPTKKGLKSIGRAPLRVSAKAVNFGVPYDRSAEAIARQCREEGVSVTVDECQQMIDGYYRRYPRTKSYLEDCEKRTQNERWICGAFGRYRRFIQSRDRGVIGEQRRQGRNFPIQNLVADAVWTAISNFTQFQRQYPEYPFKLLLQIHDALMFEVPIEHLRVFMTHILPTCMIEHVPVWPRYLDGTPMPVDQPYRFGTDTEVFLNWGEKISDAVAAELGIDPEFI